MYSIFGLFLWAMAESIFFPVPPDALLMGLVIHSPRYALWYGLLVTLGSVIGALIGYVIGLLGGRPLLERFVRVERLVKVQKMFQDHDVWAIIIAGVTPIPYKVFAISAGVFRLSVSRFLVASFIGRGLRFMLEAFLVQLYGPRILEWVTNYFDVMTLGIVGASILLFIAGNKWRVTKCKY